MHMYVANGTQQAHNFMYRLPERPGEFQLLIPPGGQVRLPHDMSTPEIDSVVAQHQRYGMVQATPNFKFDRRLAPLCYSLGSPVKLDQIHALIVANREVLTERGKRQREEAGVAIHQQMEDMMQRNQMPDRLVQVEASAQEDSADPQFAEGVRVSRSDDGGRPAGERPRIKPRGRKRAG